MERPTIKKMIPFNRRVGIYDTAKSEWEMEIVNLCLLSRPQLASVSYKMKWDEVILDLSDILNTPSTYASPGSPNEYTILRM